MTIYVYPFHKLCPKVAKKEFEDNILLGLDRETGEFLAFYMLELYCADPGCDCQKVTIMMYEASENPDPTVRATIAYGWGSVPFYQDWGYMTKEEADELRSGYLEPLEQQGEDAEKLLALFHQHLKNNPDLLPNLKRHYKLFKKEAAKKEDAARRR